MKKKSEHYVNNKEFSRAVVEYVRSVEDAEESGEDPPPVTDYIAECFMRIASGLSHKSNFVAYTYRDEMMMDAVENCLRAIRNYDIDAATRTGEPNAFSYFTQISWYAFLRRIAKEKKQYDIKVKFMFENGLEQFMISEDEDPESAHAIQQYIEQLRQKMDEVPPKSDHTPRVSPDIKPKGPRTRVRMRTDSDLADFFDNSLDM